MNEQDFEELKDNVLNHLRTIGLELNKTNIQECIYESYYGSKAILDQAVEYVITHI